MEQQQAFQCNGQHPSSCSNNRHGYHHKHWFVAMRLGLEIVDALGGPEVVNQLRDKHELSEQLRQLILIGLKTKSWQRQEGFK